MSSDFGANDEIVRVCHVHLPESPPLALRTKIDRPPVLHLLPGLRTHPRRSMCDGFLEASVPQKHWAMQIESPSNLGLTSIKDEC